MHNGILLSHKKEETSQFETIQMVLEGIMLREISQTVKDEYYTIQKKKKKKKPHRHREQIGGAQSMV